MGCCWLWVEGRDLSSGGSSRLEEGALCFLDRPQRSATDSPTDRPTAARVIAGGPEESVQQPVWDADGTLYFVSDRTNW